MPVTVGTKTVGGVSIARLEELRERRIATAPGDAPESLLNESGPCDPGEPLCQSCCWPFAWWNCRQVARTSSNEFFANCFPGVAEALTRQEFTAIRDGRVVRLFRFDETKLPTERKP